MYVLNKMPGVKVRNSSREVESRTVFNKTVSETDHSSRVAAVLHSSESAPLGYAALQSPSQ